MFLAKKGGILMTNKQLILQTDFGLADGAVSTMYGVAKTVAPALHVADLTHEITPYNIWEASYRLYQTLNYWPVGTTFVSVVDPGVEANVKASVRSLKRVTMLLHQTTVPLRISPNFLV